MLKIGTFFELIRYKIEDLPIIEGAQRTIRWLNGHRAGPNASRANPVLKYVIGGLCLWFLIHDPLRPLLSFTHLPLWFAEVIATIVLAGILYASWKPEFLTSWPILGRVIPICYVLGWYFLAGLLVLIILTCILILLLPFWPFWAFSKRERFETFLAIVLVLVVALIIGALFFGAVRIATTKGELGPMIVVLPVSCLIIGFIIYHVGRGRCPNCTCASCNGTGIEWVPNAPRALYWRMKGVEPEFTERYDESVCSYCNGTGERSRGARQSCNFCNGTGQAFSKLERFWGTVVILAIAMFIVVIVGLLNLTHSKNIDIGSLLILLGTVGFGILLYSITPKETEREVEKMTSEEKAPPHGEPEGISHVQHDSEAEKLREPYREPDQQHIELSGPKVTRQDDEGPAFSPAEISSAKKGTNKWRANVKPTDDEILGVLSGFLPLDGLHLAPRIPSKKLSNARKYCNIPENEHILGLIDCTVFGSAKHCLVFAGEGIYYNNTWYGKRRGAGVIPYKEFPNREFKEDEAEEGEEIFLGGNEFLNITSSAVSQEKIIEMLSAIKGLFEEPRRLSTPEPEKKQRALSELNHDMAVVWNENGVNLRRSGRHEEAIECFDKAVSFDPKLASALYNKGNCLGQLGRFEEAIVCFDKVLEIDPHDAEALHRKGHSLANLGRLEEAIPYLNRAIELNPQDASAWQSKGYCLGMLGQYEEAVVCFNKALEIDSEHANSWYYKASSLCTLERYEEAIVCFAKALAIDPGMAPAWFNKALAEEAIGRRTDAVQSYREFIAVAPPELAKDVEHAQRRLQELEANKNS